jgi:hypothetical protein
VRRSSIVGCALVATLALGACGSSGSGAQSPTSTTNPFVNASWDKAGPNPSISAQMVCAKEARGDIAATLRMEATKVTKPKWVRKDHLFSCAYVYPRGKIVLSVKELSSGTETTNYFDSITRKYGTSDDLNGVGQAAWVLKNSDVVVRKDYKVLLVDVTGIPERLVPAMRRSDVAVSIAAVIMGCWTGA